VRNRLGWRLLLPLLLRQRRLLAPKPSPLHRLLLPPSLPLHLAPSLLRQRGGKNPCRSTFSRLLLGLLRLQLTCPLRRLLSLSSQTSTPCPSGSPYAVGLKITEHVDIRAARFCLISINHFVVLRTAGVTSRLLPSSSPAVCWRPKPSSRWLLLRLRDREASFLLALPRPLRRVRRLPPRVRPRPQPSSCPKLCCR
jgi:hypothetical protein